MSADNFRQMLVDAAVADLRHQLGDDVSISVHGSRVQLDETFNMARVIEHVFRKAFADSSLFTEEVARGIGERSEDWEEHVGEAQAAIAGVYGVLMSRLNV